MHPSPFRALAAFAAGDLYNEDTLPHGASAPTAAVLGIPAPLFSTYWTGGRVPGVAKVEDMLLALCRHRNEALTLSCVSGRGWVVERSAGGGE